eukprot:CAMPEP_0196194428 /NCGR_PEP_ID=MMETSP0911-20130528/50058_1 /TAXON_ID=49265 /ORGANISM="Thalassiosira rotula, Strain GSO102" /LENGTH=354 /DNA_ID=CAMNT_0041466709 /DNA_START=1 /DNA_END=1066 /DNA_ORIENTATION=+
MLTVESTLPRHILVNSVLSYLDLSTLIKFSCCSPQCQTIVFQEMPKTSWNEITLSGNLTITDDQLCVFLRNIRAKENTRILSLVGCVNIKGPGLEPLYGSDVLENIDLRILGSLPLTGELGTMCGPSGLMDDCVARILFSMLPLSQREWEEPGIWYAKATKRPKISLRRVAIRPLKPTVGMSIHYSPILRNFFTCHGFLIGRSATPIAPLTCPPNACSLCFIEIDYQQEGIFCPTATKITANHAPCPPNVQSVRNESVSGAATSCNVPEEDAGNEVARVMGTSVVGGATMFFAWIVRIMNWNFVSYAMNFIVLRNAIGELIDLVFAIPSLGLILRGIDIYCWSVHKMENFFVDK